MRVEGSAVTGYSTTGHIALPKPTGRQHVHREYTRKPKGLDWAALTPTCKTCDRRTSRLNRDDECLTCAAPVEPPATAHPVKKREPKPPKSPRPRAQYPKPIGPRPRPNRRRSVAQYPRPIGPVRRPTGGGGRPNTRHRVDEQAIVQAYLKGATSPALAAVHDVTPKRVRAILDRHGIERRDDRTTHSGSTPRYYDAALRADVARLYLGGWSRTKVAETLGIPFKTVVTIMTRDRIPARQRQAGRLDGAAPLKARIRDLGTTACDINRWALDTGLMDLPKPGIPSTFVVDAWEAAHNEAEEAS